MRASWSLRIASARPPEKAPSERDDPCSERRRTGEAAVPVALESRESPRRRVNRCGCDREQIVEGLALVERALSSGRFGDYTLQAAIAAVHAQARTAEETDWGQIVALYTLLAQANPSPVVELNRAVAVAMLNGPQAGLALIDEILARGELVDYHLAHSAQAELCRRLGKNADARIAYQRALDLARQEPERRFLEERLRELPG